MVRIILAVIALAILASVAVAGLQAGLEDAGVDHDIANETWTPDAGNVTTLDESHRAGAYYAHNVTVEDDTGTEMQYGSDYIWYPGNGTVKAVTGGGLDGDTSATIDYSFQQTTQEQRGMASLLGQVPRVMGMVLPLGVLFLLFALIRA